jgi:large subunit ribosomal protein L4
MIEIPVKSVAGEVVRQLQLDERVWGITPNTAVLHQAVVAQLANKRKGTHSTKTRGMVAGGGRKPWRQKGTGRARQGSTRAPHWRGGGIVFGPHPRSYHKDLPRKMRRLAMRSALSAKVQDGELIVIDAFSLPAAKTREMAATLDRLGASGSALIVLGGPDEQVKRAAANLPKIRTVMPGSANLVDVLNHRWLLMTVDAIEALTRTLTQGLRESAPGNGEGARERAGRTAPQAAAPGAQAATPAPAPPSAEPAPTAASSGPQGETAATPPAGASAAPPSAATEAPAAEATAPRSAAEPSGTAASASDDTTLVIEPAATADDDATVAIEPPATPPTSRSAQPPTQESAP